MNEFLSSLYLNEIKSFRVVQRINYTRSYYIFLQNLIKTNKKKNKKKYKTEFELLIYLPTGYKKKSLVFNVVLMAKIILEKTACKHLLEILFEIREFISLFVPGYSILCNRKSKKCNKTNDIKHKRYKMQKQ